MFPPKRSGLETLRVRCSLLELQQPHANGTMVLAIRFLPKLNLNLHRKIQHLPLHSHLVMLPPSDSQEARVIYGITSCP